MSRKIADPQDWEAKYPADMRVLKRGAAVLVLTCTTHYWIGRVVNYDALKIILSDAAWVPIVGTQ